MSSALLWQRRKYCGKTSLMLSRQQDENSWELLLCTISKLPPSRWLLITKWQQLEEAVKNGVRNPQRFRTFACNRCLLDMPRSHWFSQSWCLCGKRVCHSSWAAATTDGRNCTKSKGCKAETWESSEKAKLKLNSSIVKRSYKNSLYLQRAKADAYRMNMQNRARLGDRPVGYIPDSGNVYLRNLLKDSWCLYLHLPVEQILMNPFSKKTSFLTSLSRWTVPQVNNWLKGEKYFIYSNSTIWSLCWLPPHFD